MAAELQSPKMEIAKQRMHRSLRKDVEKRMVNLESSVQREGSKILCQIGKGGGYEFLRRTRERIN